jgi:hypothetical protein
MSNGSGLFITPFSEAKLELRLPENVMNAKIQGIKNEKISK